MTEEHSDNGQNDIQTEEPLLLARVVAMPSGKIQIELEQSIDDIPGFCMACAQHFIGIAGQHYRKPKPQSRIVVPPPGMRIR
jgi:hypothetical protein